MEYELIPGGRWVAVATSRGSKVWIEIWDVNSGDEATITLSQVLPDSLPICGFNIQARDDRSGIVLAILQNDIEEKRYTKILDDCNLYNL